VAALERELATHTQRLHVSDATIGRIEALAVPRALL
jgi:hypothetical protein